MEKKETVAGGARVRVQSRTPTRRTGDDTRSGNRQIHCRVAAAAIGDDQIGAGDIGLEVGQRGADAGNLVQGRDDDREGG